MGYPLDLDDRSRVIHAAMRSKGFWDRETLDGGIRNPSLASEKLMLIVSEVAEVQDALRDGNDELEAEELADVMIRTFDYAAWRGINLDVVISKKMGKNRDRPHLHGRSQF